jgi:hypothetical protein
MSVAETKLDGAGGSPSMPTAAAGSPRRRWRRAWLLAASVLAFAVVGVLLGKAAVYQPLGWGGLDGPFRACRQASASQGSQQLRTSRRRLLRAAPARRVFLRRFDREQRLAARDYRGGNHVAPADGSYPVRLAGPVLYTTDMGRLGAPQTHALRNLTLGPGQGIFIGIPLRMQPCGQADGWSTDAAFYAKEHFLFFTHTVPIPWA